jgi:glutathione S-transferase
MTMFSMSNPVFVTYVITAAIMILKLMGQGWMTVYRMLRVNSGWASPEDMKPGLINRDPQPGQLDINDYVDRSRRMHRNDLENIPGFLAAGLIFVAVGPSLLLAHILMYGFVGARALHAIAYATKRSHEVRALFYSFGSLAVIAMAGYTLATALG